MPITVSSSYFSEILYVMLYQAITNGNQSTKLKNNMTKQFVKEPETFYIWLGTMNNKITVIF